MAINAPGKIRIGAMKPATLPAGKPPMDMPSDVPTTSRKMAPMTPKPKKPFGGGPAGFLKDTLKKPIAASPTNFLKDKGANTRPLPGRGE